jgi:hypothetical protein
VGLISKSKENKIWNIGNTLQSSSLYLGVDCTVFICSGENCSQTFNKNNELQYRNNSIVDIEVGCEKKTIFFFINKKQCPYYISEISSSSFPLLFGFRSWKSPVIEIVSLFKILPPSSYISPSSECEEIKWVLIFLFY